MWHEFTLDIPVAGRFCTTADMRAAINTEMRQWSVDDVEFWDCTSAEWVTLDRQDVIAVELERLARDYLKAPATRVEIDNLVGHHLLEAGIIPVPEYEHLTGRDCGLPGHRS